MEHVLTSPRLMSILYSFHAPVQAVFTLTKIPPFTVSPPFQFVFHCLLSAPPRKYSQHCLQAVQTGWRLEAGIFRRRREAAVTTVQHNPPVVAVSTLTCARSPQPRPLCTRAGWCSAHPAPGPTPGPSASSSSSQTSCSTVFAPRLELETNIREF